MEMRLKRFVDGELWYVGICEKVRVVGCVCWGGGERGKSVFCMTRACRLLILVSYLSDCKEQPPLTETSFPRSPGTYEALCPLSVGTSFLMVQWHTK